MIDAPAGQLSAAFAAAIGAAATGPDTPGSLLGLEHEYSLSDGERPVDFRDLIHSLGVPGLPLDPGDRNAYRLPSGLVLTCDDAEAEVASPPVRLQPGFTNLIEAWAATGRAELLRLLPPGIAATGYSTHLSAAMPDALNARVADLYARTFAPALMLLIDGPDSHGIYIRPRAGRLELCGDYVSGARLGAVAAFVAGSATACAAGNSPPALAARLAPAISRYGLYVSRRAVGPDLYAEGRAAVLTREDGTTITAQQHLEVAWAAARNALAAHADGSDLAVIDRMVAGTLPLGTEGHPDGNGSTARSHSPADGAVIQPVNRPGFTATAVIAVWPFTVFRLAGSRRSAFACVPRAHLPQFIRRLTSGELDAAVVAYLNSQPTGRTLASHGQTQEPGLWDDVGEPLDLLPPERDAKGEYRQEAKGDRTGKLPRPGKAGRSGKLPVTTAPSEAPRAAGAPLAPPVVPPPPPPRPPRPPRPESGGGIPPWKYIAPLVAAFVAVVIGAAVVIGGGSSGGSDTSPSPTPSGSPESSVTSARTASPTATRTREPTRTATPTPTGSGTVTPSPSPTISPTISPTPTPTPEPTAAGPCDLTIAGSSNPGNGLITYVVQVAWVCPPGSETDTHASVHVDDALPLQSGQQAFTPIGPPQIITTATSGAIGCSGPPHAHAGAPGFDTSRFGCDAGILPANGGATITVTLDIGSGQALTNTAVVDADNLVPESNEGNNQAQTTDLNCCP